MLVTSGPSPLGTGTFATVATTGIPNFGGPWVETNYKTLFSPLSTTSMSTHSVTGLSTVTLWMVVMLPLTGTSFTIGDGTSLSVTPMISHPARVRRSLTMLLKSSDCAGKAPILTPVTTTASSTTAGTAVHMMLLIVVFTGKHVVLVPGNGPTEGHNMADMSVLPVPRTTVSGVTKWTYPILEKEYTVSARTVGVVAVASTGGSHSGSVSSGNYPFTF